MVDSVYRLLIDYTYEVQGEFSATPETNINVKLNVNRMRLFMKFRAFKEHFQYKLLIS